MLFKTSSTVRFFAHYTASGLGKTGITVTVSVTGPGGNIVTRASATAASALDATNSPGLYYYDLSSGSTGTEGAYTVNFTTTDTTVDKRDQQSLAYFYNWIGYVNGAGGNLLAASSYSAPPSAASIRAEIDSNSAKLDATVSSRSTLTAAGVWDALLTGITTVGSVGKLIKDYLDAQVSTRVPTSSYTAPLDSTSTASAVQTGLTAQGLTPTRSAYLDVLNGIVAAITAAVWGAASRTLTAFGFDVTVGTNLDKSDYELSASDHLAISDDVWDEPTANHATAGSTGEALTGAANANSLTVGAIADAVWDELIAGHQGAGSTGEVLTSVAQAIATGQVTVISAVNATGDLITLKAGDTYSQALGKALNFTAKSTYPSLTDGSVKLTLKTKYDETVMLEKAGTIVDATHFRFELTSSETADLQSGLFDVQVTFASGDIDTYGQGTLKIVNDISL